MNTSRHTEALRHAVNFESNSRLRSRSVFFFLLFLFSAIEVLLLLRKRMNINVFVSCWKGQLFGVELRHVDWQGHVCVYWPFWKEKKKGCNITDIQRWALYSKTPMLWWPQSALWCIWAFVQFLHFTNLVHEKSFKLPSLLPTYTDSKEAVIYTFPSFQSEILHVTV